jgi:SAM-dependent methyltransferase
MLSRSAMVRMCKLKNRTGTEKGVETCEGVRISCCFQSGSLRMKHLRSSSPYCKPAALYAILAVTFKAVKTMNLTATTCDLCEGRDARLLFEASGYPIMECRACGLVFTGSVLAPGDREALYRNEYYVGAADYAETMKRAAVTGNPDYEDCVRMASKLVPRAPGTILDVGCGAGGLLAAFKLSGWKCYGIEPSADMSAYARGVVGCEIYEGTLEAAPLPAAAFDLITARHVLEHSATPRGFLRACLRSLSDDGVLLLEVPDFGSRSARKQQADWRPLYPDTHLYHFTSRTLTRLLRSCGFHPVRIRRYGGLGILSTPQTNGSPQGLNSAETGTELSILNTAKRRVFEARRHLYRFPAIKQVVRYAYWHLLQMNEYLRIYAVKAQ